MQNNIQLVKAKSVHITSADYVGEAEAVYISTENKNTTYATVDEGGTFDEVKIIIVDRDVYVTVIDGENTVFERWFGIVNYWIKAKR